MKIIKQKKQGVVFMKRKGSKLADKIIQERNRQRYFEGLVKRRNANNGRRKEQSRQTSKI